VRLEHLARPNSNSLEEPPHSRGRRDSGFAKDLNRMLQLVPERNNEIVGQLPLVNHHSEYSMGASHDD
jgi:hypothetical protein